jgi:hypothetical protein
MFPANAAVKNYGGEHVPSQSPYMFPANAAVKNYGGEHVPSQCRRKKLRR